MQTEVIVNIGLSIMWKCGIDPAEYGVFSPSGEKNFKGKDCFE